MDINYEKLKKTLVKILESNTSEKGLFALTYDVSTGSAPTFSRRDSWKRKSCASTQLPPRTYYFNYDKNLVNELFSSQNSYTFSRYSYDAPTDINFDEIYYYNSYLNMQRLFENIDRNIGIDQEDIYNSSYEEHLMPREEKRLHSDDSEAKHKEFNDDIIKEGGGDSGGHPNIWYTQYSSYYSTPTNYMYWDSNKENEDILMRNSMLDAKRSKSAEGL